MSSCDCGICRPAVQLDVVADALRDHVGDASERLGAAQEIAARVEDEIGVRFDRAAFMVRVFADQAR